MKTKGTGIGKGIVLIYGLIVGIFLLSTGTLEAARPPALRPGRDFVIQTYNYDDGFLISVTDANGNITNYKYGLRSEQTNAEGDNLLRFHYDGSGNLTSIVDQNDNVTNYSGGRTTDVGYWEDAAGNQVAPGDGVTFIKTAEYVYGTDGILDKVKNFRLNAAEAFVDANGNGVWDAGEDFTDTNSNGVWDDNELVDYSETIYVDGKPTEEILVATTGVDGLVAGALLRKWNYEGGLLQSVETTTAATAAGLAGRTEYQTTYFEGGREAHVTNFQGTVIVEYNYDGAKLVSTYNTVNDQTTLFDAMGRRRDVRAGDGAGDETTIVSSYVYDGAVLIRRDDYDAAGAIFQSETYEHNQPTELELADGSASQTYTYINGFLASVTDHSDNSVTNYAYGMRTNKAYSDGSGTVLTFKYDASGGLSSITDQNGTVTNYTGGSTIDIGYWVDAAGERVAPEDGATFISTRVYSYGADGLLDYVIEKRKDAAGDLVDYSKTHYDSGGRAINEELLIDESELPAEQRLGLTPGQDLTQWTYNDANGALATRKVATSATEWNTTHMVAGREDHVTNGQGTTIVTYHYNGAALSYTYDIPKDQTTWFNGKGQRRFVVDGNTDPDPFTNWDNMDIDQLAGEGVSVHSEFVYDAAADDGGDDDGATIDYRDDHAWAAGKPAVEADYYNYQTEYYEFSQPIETRGHEPGEGVDGTYNLVVTATWLTSKGALGTALAAMGIKAGESIQLIVEGGQTVRIRHEKTIDAAYLSFDDTNWVGELATALLASGMTQAEVNTWVGEHSTELEAGDTLETLILITGDTAEIDQIKDGSGTVIIDLHSTTVVAANVTLTVDPAMFGVAAIDFTYDASGNVLQVKEAGTDNILLYVNYTDASHNTLASVVDAQGNTVLFNADGSIAAAPDPAPGWASNMWGDPAATGRVFQGEDGAWYMRVRVWTNEQSTTAYSSEAEYITIELDLSTAVNIGGILEEYETSSDLLTLFGISRNDILSEGATLVVLDIGKGGFQSHPYDTIIEGRESPDPASEEVSLSTGEGPIDIWAVLNTNSPSEANYADFRNGMDPATQARWYWPGITAHLSDTEYEQTVKELYVMITGGYLKRDQSFTTSTGIRFRLVTEGAGVRLDAHRSGTHGTTWGTTHSYWRDEKGGSWAPIRHIRPVLVGYWNL